MGCFAHFLFRIRQIENRINGIPPDSLITILGRFSLVPVSLQQVTTADQQMEVQRLSGT